MTDNKDLDFLRQQMDAATPAPEAGRRAENLTLAMANFDHIQGSQADPRLSNDRPKAGLLAGVWTMLTTRSAALTGTTALVAGVLLITNPFAGLMSPPGDASDVVANLGLREADAEILQEDAPGSLSSVGEAMPPPIVAETLSQSAEPLLQPSAVPLEPPMELGDTEVVNEALVDRALATSDAPEPNPELAVTRGTEIMTEDQLRGVMNTGILSTLSEPGTLFAEQRYVSVPSPEVVAPGVPSTETYPQAETNPLQVTLENPVSTFSIDVDTASYALLRSSLNRGQLPHPDAVRIEEMVNYFSYEYPAPEPEAEAPFEPSFTVFETPWNPDTQLVHIALQGELPDERPPLNLVFLIDVSGSMNEPAKLPLLIQSFRLMLGELAPDDQVAIVTYAGRTGIALEPTPASDRATIEAALTSLQAGGSTNGQGGLQAAYDLAGRMTEDGEVSRVILATDGDFNVGLSDPEELTDYIADERESGTYLSVLGLGRGNLQDATMQALAQNGNGTAAYIDTLHEAQRVLVDQLSGALFPIANDVKVQIEFNPARVAEYRLIGYETRALAREDFNNDAVDAGELGAGHRVTAVYEITPVGSPAIRTDPLRYGDTAALPLEAEALSDELGFLRLRWKEPGEDQSTLMDFPVTETEAPSSDILFGTAIAGFGQLLQGSEFLGSWGYDDAIALAQQNRGSDPFGLRAEAVQLMRLAESLDRTNP